MTYTKVLNIQSFQFNFPICIIAYFTMIREWFPSIDAFISTHKRLLKKFPHLRII